MAPKAKTAKDENRSSKMTIYLFNTHYVSDVV